MRSASQTRPSWRGLRELAKEACRWSATLEAELGDEQRLDHEDVLQGHPQLCEGDAPGSGGGVATTDGDAVREAPPRESQEEAGQGGGEEAGRPRPLSPQPGVVEATPAEHALEFEHLAAS